MFKLMDKKIIHPIPMRRFFEYPKQMFKLMDKKILTILRLEIILQDLCFVINS